jgi:beta-lactamase superfamily II metal-dependent hydrolase
MEDRGINSVFRFMLSHPDMDHLDGIKAFFDRFSPANFWDTDNTCAKDDFGYGRYQRADWDFYKTMRDGKTKACKRLTLYSGATGQFWNRNADGSAGADGLYVLAPTPELVAQANKSNDFNDCSYVILYRTGNRKILFSGDSHDGTWEHVLAAHEDDVRNVDLLIAPHHGRASDRSYEFLDTVNPRQTYFGNAPYEHLAYDAWNNRDLPFITNNQANCMVVETDSNSMSQYITNKTFAEASYPETFYSERHMAYYIGDI